MLLCFISHFFNSLFDFPYSENIRYEAMIPQYSHLIELTQNSDLEVRRS